MRNNTMMTKYFEPPCTVALCITRPFKVEDLQRNMNSQPHGNRLFAMAQAYITPVSAQRVNALSQRRRQARQSLLK